MKKQILINKIEIAADNKDPIVLHGYKVSVYDVSSETAEQYKKDTGDEFEADCTHAKYDIYFIDECNVRRAIVSINFDGEIISSDPSDMDLLEQAGFIA